MEEKKYLVLDGKQTKIEDLTGRKFNHWTVLRFDKEKSAKKIKSYWICQCDCENKTVKSVEGYSLKIGNNKSCGAIEHLPIRYENLVNKKFGNLTVTSLYNRKNKDGRVEWLCNCDCGNKNIIAITDVLKSGKKQSCGCLFLKKQKERRVIDLAGQTFGRLIVIGEDFKREEELKKCENSSNKRYWLCKCSCGNEKLISVSQSALRQNKQKSCGCYAFEERRSRAKDITGQKFGKLTALKRDYEKENQILQDKGKYYTYWYCKCDCGNFKTVKTSDLKNKTKTNSCGCLSKESTNKANKENGILKNGSLGDWMLKNLPEDFIESYWSNTNKSSPFELPYAGRNKIYIICDKCNEEYSIDTYNFTLDNQRCFRCIPNSKGENKIESILRKYKISFRKQEKFKDLVGINNGLLSYDFCLYDNNILIEYQGEQHFYPIDFFGGKAQFDIQKHHDNMKKEYAKLHNYNMLEISYLDFDNVEEILKEKLNII